MTAIVINIYWDAICPWCYIAHRTLTRAIELFRKTYPNASEDAITFAFHPFYRSPDAPTTGITWYEAVARKNGPERVDGIRLRLEREGRENGILFSTGNRIGSTRDCHRMVREFARPKGWEAELRVMEKVFEWHFECDGDITSRAELARVAVEAGVAEDEDEVLKFLRSDRMGGEIDELVEDARKEGVKHVPTFVIGERWIEGAEDASVFYEALAAAKEGVKDGLRRNAGTVCVD